MRRQCHVLVSSRIRCCGTDATNGLKTLEVPAHRGYLRLRRRIVRPFETPPTRAQSVSAATEIKTP